MSAPLNERRPSAGSLRNKRSSTFGDGSQVPVHDPMPLNAGNLNQYLVAPGNEYGGGGPAGGMPPSRPPMRTARSSDGPRNRGLSISGAADNSKVGAILLNKRQSVSFGKAQAATVRAGLRPDAAPPLPTASSREMAPHQGSGRPHLHGSHGRPMTAGEELVANAQKGPGGMPLNDLLKEDFVTELFVKSHLTPGAAASPSAQLEDLRKLKNVLAGLLNATQSNFQSNVIANYTEFIQVSKDIAALESEMLELKSVLEEWKTVPEGLAVEQSFDAASPAQSGGLTHSSGAKVNRRNSLADLQALYRTQLETLWEAVEGAQRFLPMIPGRHVLGRHAGWIELNSATYRPRQQVTLILLNDALLVSIEKRRQMGGATRIVADRCFILNEIAVTDLRDTGDVTNAIRIKRDREVHIFRNEKAEDKRGLLSAFKKILEDTMQKRRKQSVWEAEQRRDQTASSGRRMSEIEAPQKSALASFRPATVFPFLGNDYPSGKDLGWIDDVCDKLATLMALRDFEEAICIVEAAKSIYATVAAEPLAEQVLREKIDQRSYELCSILLASLSDPSIRKAGVVRHSSWLLRLGQGEKARDTFLAARGDLLKQRASEIVFASQQEGFAGGNPTVISQALVNEIAQLAFVCFAVIRNTSDWYMAAYQDPQNASAFVKWATSQVEVFAGGFKKHMYMTALPKSNALIQQCHDIAVVHSQVLKEVGLDFAFLLQQALVYTPPPLPARDYATERQHPSSVDAMEHIEDEPVQPLSFRKRPPTMSASEGLS